MAPRNLTRITAPRRTLPTSLGPSPSCGCSVHPALIEAEPARDRRWQAAFDEQHDLALDHPLAEAREQMARGKALDPDELL